MRPLVLQVDPKLERTLFISTKFNNRLNQFRDANEAETFMKSSQSPSFSLTDNEVSGPTTITNFFMSLPSGPQARNLSDDQFKNSIRDFYLKDFFQLNLLGISPDLLPRYGFYQIKRHLESILNQQYKKSLQPISKKLSETIRQQEEKLKQLQNEIQVFHHEADPKEQCSQLQLEYLNLFHLALRGATVFNPMKNGYTLTEEREHSGCPRFPMMINFPIMNETYRLYGGSQLERLLAEFVIAVLGQEFPKTTNDEVVNATIGLSLSGPGHIGSSLFGSGIGNLQPNIEHGACELSQKKVSEVFIPLIFILMERCRFIITHVFQMLVEHMIVAHKSEFQMLSNNDEDSPTDKTRYDPFFELLQNVSFNFLEQDVLKNLKELCLQELESLTKMMGFDPPFNRSSCSSNIGYDLLNPTTEDTEKRVQLATAENVEKREVSFGKNMTEERCEEVKLIAARLFAVVRDNVARFIPARFHMFMSSKLTELDSTLKEIIGKQSQENLRAMVGNNLDVLQEKEKLVRGQLEVLKQQKQKFSSLLDKLGQHLDSSSKPLNESP